MIKKPNLNNKKGFTIIELVVVVVILSLLALILLPNMTSYKERANTKKIQTEMAGVYTVTKSALDEAKLPGFMFDSENKAVELFDSENKAVEPLFISQLDDFTNLGSEKLGRYEFVVVNDKLTLFYEEDGRWYVYDGTFEESSELPSDYISITEHYKDTTVSEIIPEPTVFLVQFLDEKGEVKKRQMVKSGENATPPTLYKEGYELSWDESYEGIFSDTTINAQWGIKMYTVTFNPNEGSVSELTRSGELGSTITNFPTPTRDNTYRFLGWFTDVNGGEKTTEITNIDRDITLYAQWEDTYLATDDDFTWTNDNGGYTATNEDNRGYYKYTGEAEIVKIPHVINGHPMTSYYMMFGSPNFESTRVKKVISDNSNVTNMSYMFYNSQATTLDLSSFDTSNVTTMYNMFYYCKATTLDLRNFETSNVTNMSFMFRDSQATTLDLSSFKTSNVTDMSSMFRNNKATTLDLSSFDTSNVTSMNNMFKGSQATSLDLSSFDTSNVTDMSDMFANSKATTGYARTQADADRFNASSGQPAGLTFIVK